MSEKLNAKVCTPTLDAQGRWLTIRFKDIEGLDSSLNTYDHHKGTFGAVVIKGITKEFVYDLALKLHELTCTWKINS